MILRKKGSKTLKKGGLIYSEKDIVSFGNYLLSADRKKMVSKPSRGDVGHWDLENWKHKENTDDA